MAWYALYKWFVPWRKTKYTNWIDWYRRYLYDEWFNSLSEDQQKAETERLRRIREQRKRDLEMAFASLAWMYSFMDDKLKGCLER